MVDNERGDGQDELDDDTDQEDEDEDEDEDDEELEAAESLFVGLVEYFNEWVTDSPDRDLIEAEHAVLRFAAATTLMLMHDIVDDPGNAGAGLSREEVAKAWISDMCRDFADMLLNQDMISGTAELVGKPDIRLHFDRAFRRRLLTG